MTEPTQSEHPQSCLDWLQKAESYRDQQDIENSIQCYRQAIKIDSQNIVVLESLGDFCYEQKELTRAIAFYKKVIQLNDNEPDSTLKKRLAQKLVIALQQRAAQDQEQLLLNYQENIAQEPYRIDYYHQAIALDANNIDL